jgi:hypothetical protein
MNPDEAASNQEEDQPQSNGDGWDQDDDDDEEPDSVAPSSSSSGSKKRLFNNHSTDIAIAMKKTQAWLAMRNVTISEEQLDRLRLMVALLVVATNAFKDKEARDVQTPEKRLRYWDTIMFNKLKIPPSQDLLLGNFHDNVLRFFQVATTKDALMTLLPLCFPRDEVCNLSLAIRGRITKTLDFHTKNSNSLRVLHRSRS